MSPALLTREPKTRESRLGGSPFFSAKPKKRPADAKPRQRAALTCDFCRSALAIGERHRLVWESAVAGELVLAEVCAGCATRFSDSALRSSTSQLDTLRLVQDVRASPPALKVAGFAARGALYVLIAVTFFLIVTLISSSAH